MKPWKSHFESSRPNWQVSGDKGRATPSLNRQRARTSVRAVVSAKLRSVDLVFYVLVGLTAATFVGEILFVFLKAPIEARMGIVQKIFYFHVPSAYAMYIG